MGYRVPKGLVRLDRALSKRALATRTEAHRLIRAGKVKINGRVILDPGRLVRPETVKIEIEGLETESAHSQVITLVMNKAKGAVTTRSDELGRKTVFDVTPQLPPGVMPVGRLDAATRGVLLFTNDTRLSAWLLDPVNRIMRTYLVVVRGEVTPQRAEQIQNGITDRGQRLYAEAVVIRKSSKRETHLVVTLSEGKNREVRRIFESIGCPVTDLKRASFGAIPLGELAPGQWRIIEREELLRAFVGAPVRDNLRSLIE